jgi:hypothetical protein
MMLNNMPIRLVSNCEMTVETSAYGSALVASRIAAELILETLGVASDRPTFDVRG